MKKFETVVAECLKIPEDSVRPELTPKDIPEWDSMNYLLLIAEIEKEYDVSFDMNEVLSTKCLGDVEAALRAKGITI